LGAAEGVGGDPGVGHEVNGLGSGGAEGEEEGDEEVGESGHEEILSGTTGTDGDPMSGSSVYDNYPLFHDGFQGFRILNHGDHGGTERRENLTCIPRVAEPIWYEEPLATSQEFSHRWTQMNTDGKRE
jgi:hypothetical protein